jgi:hypothetical protein
MQNNEYYWLCSYPLESGAVVLPGNWGRIVKNYKIGNCNLVVLLNEYLFEEVRKSEFSEKPSRMESIFLCDSQSSLETFKHSTGREWDLSYKVELVDLSQPVFKTNWELANTTNGDNVKSIKEKAKRYWQGATGANCEILTTSPIRILETI